MNTISSTTPYNYNSSVSTSQNSRKSDFRNGDIFLQNVLQALNDTDLGIQNESDANIDEANRALNNFSEDFHLAVDHVHEFSSTEENTAEELAVESNDIANLQNDVNDIITNLGGVATPKTVQQFLAHLARNQMLVAG